MSMTFGKEQSAATGAVPKVDLLPIGIKKRKGQRRVRTWLIIGLVLTIVVVIGAIGWASFTAVEAGLRLASAQNTTSILQEQQAEYAEVPDTLNQIDMSVDAVNKATVVEIQWKQLMGEIRSMMPEGYTLEKLEADGLSLLDTPSFDPETLANGQVVSIYFKSHGKTVVSMADWLTAMRGVTGYSIGWVDKAERGTDNYTVEGTLKLSGAVISSPDRPYMPEAE